MQLQNLMPNVSSISLTDTQGHYLRAPAVIAGKESETFDARTRPWFVAQAESSTFSRYTRPYEDYFTHHPTVTLYKPVISPEGRLKGTLAFHLDLASMGYTLRQMVSPVQGEFFVVERDGKVILHPDQYFDVAIAEQHAVTFAAGLAIGGYKPIVAIYSTFLQRAYDQVIHDVAIQKLPVVSLMAIPSPRQSAAARNTPIHIAPIQRPRWVRFR
jgi:hypothetical protein